MGYCGLPCSIPQFSLQIYCFSAETNNFFRRKMQRVMKLRAILVDAACWRAGCSALEGGMQRAGGRDAA
jgi:hypothetical protein